MSTDLAKDRRRTISVLHLSVTEGGGAGRAAQRLHGGLLTLGVRSSFLVDRRVSQDQGIIPRSFGPFGRRGAQLYAYLDKLPIFLLCGKRGMPWSINWMPRTTAAAVNRLEPDIVNLHWIGDGYIALSELPRIRAPLVWTLHDMWPFTGGCHYDENCGRYRQSCGHCPQLGSKHDHDLSRWVWTQKSRSWRSVPITVVAPSRWMDNCARRSSLFGVMRIEHIPYGIDADVYRPLDKAEARAQFNLPHDSTLILFGAAAIGRDTRKGLQLLPAAIERIAPRLGSCTLVTFGSVAEQELPRFPIPARHLGAFHSEADLAALYAAADVFVAPSQQDNLPNTVMEALACGTPCVAFDIGGMPDMIEHRRNGYLARPYESDDLAAGIAWVVEDLERWRKLSEHARRKVEREFTIMLQAQRYRALYEELLEARQRVSPP